MHKREIIQIRGTDYEVCDCGVCGTTYTVLAFIRDNHRRLGGFAFCPNGHQWGWKEGTEKTDAVRLERDRLKQQVAQKDDEIALAWRTATERRLEAEKAKRQATQLKKRAAAGVCPCCNRTFSELAKHIATKHPSFRAEDIARENVVSLVKGRARA